MTLSAFTLFLIIQAGLPGYIIAAGITGSGQDSAVVSLPQNDKEMLAAAKKARTGLDDFLDKLENPASGTSAYAIKIGFADEGDDFVIVHGEHDSYFEYIWVTDIVTTATGFLGIIDNDPENVRNVASGQHVAFGKDDIFDWSYVENGKIRGNATACPLLRKGPQEELDYHRQELGMDC